MHKVIELHSTEKRPSGLELVRLVRENLEQIITASPQGLLRWIHHRHGIAGVLPAALITAAARLAYKSLSPGAAQNERVSRRTWREERFSSEELGMDGWPDLVQQNGDSLHVIDYKLGLGRGQDGAPNPDYVLQIAAYGLIAKHATRLSSVTLELRAPDDVWFGKLNRELEEEVQQIASELNTLLPRGKKLDLQQLSRLGQHCQKCSVRASCPAYARQILAGEDDSAGVLSPLDIAGAVTSVTFDGEAHTISLVTKRQGRRATVSGVVEAVVPQTILAGDELNFFSLETSEIRGRGRYISNFHVWNRTSPVNSAFTCLIRGRQRS